MGRRTAGREEGGFTLIELLVVVVIIGVLATIAIPVALNQFQRGYQAALMTDVRNAALAVESHFAQTGIYPLDQSAFEAVSPPESWSGEAGVTQLDYRFDTAGANGTYCIRGRRTNLPGYVDYLRGQHGSHPYTATPAIGDCTP